MALKIKKRIVSKPSMEVTTTYNREGKILKKIVSPLRVDFRLKDILQVIIGASILAIPVGFTEETWKFGEVLPWSNIMGLLLLSLLFIAAFTYYHYHKNQTKRNWKEFIKRTFLTYIFSFIVVAILLTLVQKAPWATDRILALKRVIIVTFPSSMSGTVADVIK